MGIVYIQFKHIIRSLPGISPHLGTYNNYFFQCKVFIEDSFPSSQIISVCVNFQAHTLLLLGLRSKIQNSTPEDLLWLLLSLSLTGLTTF